MSDITKLMCPNFEMGRGYCLFPANHEGGCVFPKPVNRSAKELADAIQSNPEESVKILAEHELALTAAVRRDVLNIASDEIWEEIATKLFDVKAAILALTTLEQQSALDAYRDSVLAPVREYLEHSWNCNIQLKPGFDGPFVCTCGLESALKGSSDAAKEA